MTADRCYYDGCEEKADPEWGGRIAGTEKMVALCPTHLEQVRAATKEGRKFRLSYPDVTMTMLAGPGHLEIRSGRPRVKLDP